MESAQDFYSHRPTGAPVERASELQSLPRDIGSLCRTVQGVLVHRDIAPWLYQLNLSAKQRDLANARRPAQILAQIRAINDQPLAEARTPAQRMPCVCSHFSYLLAAMLREQGVPARARCGFGAYFTPGRFEDHWVAEYWDGETKRWVLVDAQIDSIQRNAFKLDFDPLDVPRNQFIIAGDAWQMCRAGRADPNLFGLSFLKEQGMWWIAANVIRDLASLNRREVLPWDVWGIMHEPNEPFAAGEEAFLDYVAQLTLVGDKALPQLLEVYQDERLKLPEMVFNADRKQRETVTS
jgi:hypothetical protein